MDAISFINSRDVRKYLYDIQFEPDLLQSAYFIYNSKLKLVEEKHRAFEELCQSTDDIILSEEIDLRWKRPETKGRSVHELIREHIRREKQWLSCFYEKDERAIYTPEYTEIADRDSFDPKEYVYTRVDDGRFFSDFEAAFKMAKMVIADDDKGEIASYSILKHFVNDEAVERSKKIMVGFNRNHEVMSIDHENFILELPHSDDIDELIKKENDFSVEWEFFKMMWFDIPIPFKKGDIVIGTPKNWGLSVQPFVLLDTVPWFYEGKNYKGRRKSGYDSSDMNASGWSVGFYGSNTAIDDDVMADYLDLEYYRGEYNGLQRLLPILAAFHKGEIDAWCYTRWTEYIINESKLKGNPVEEAKYFGYEDKIIHMLEGKTSYEDYFTKEGKDNE